MRHYAKSGTQHFDFDYLGNGKYRWTGEPIRYFSKRYQKWVEVPTGYVSDGSTGWLDVVSLYWWVHDVLCATKKWADGTSCSRWQASMVLGDIARSDSYWAAGTLGVIVTWIAGAF